jgi:hypothetical protein
MKISCKRNWSGFLIRRDQVKKWNRFSAFGSQVHSNRRAVGNSAEGVGEGRRSGVKRYYEWNSSYLQALRSWSLLVSAIHQIMVVTENIQPFSASRWKDRTSDDKSTCSKGFASDRCHCFVCQGVRSACETKNGVGNKVTHHRLD